MVRIVATLAGAAACFTAIAHLEWKWIAIYFIGQALIAAGGQLKEADDE